MEGYCSTGQNPQWAVVSMEEEGGKKKKYIISVIIYNFIVLKVGCLHNKRPVYVLCTTLPELELLLTSGFGSNQVHLHMHGNYSITFIIQRVAGPSGTFAQRCPSKVIRSISRLASKRNSRPAASA